MIFRPGGADIGTQTDDGVAWLIVNASPFDCDVSFFSGVTVNGVHVW